MQGEIKQFVTVNKQQLYTKNKEKLKFHHKKFLFVAFANSKINNKSVAYANILKSIFKVIKKV